MADKRNKLELQVNKLDSTLQDAVKTSTERRTRKPVVIVSCNGSDEKLVNVWLSFTLIDESFQVLNNYGAAQPT